MNDFFKNWDAPSLFNGVISVLAFITLAASDNVCVCSLGI